MDDERPLVADDEVRPQSSDADAAETDEGGSPPRARSAMTDRLLVGLAVVLIVATAVAGFLAYRVISTDHVPVSIADQDIQSLKASIEENPDDLGAQFALADLYYQLEEYKKAADTLQAIIERGAEGQVLAEALYGMAMIERGRGDDDTAMDSLLASLEVTETPRARYELGNLYMDRAQYEEAIENLQRFVEAEPANVDGLKALARALEASGDTEQSLATWEQVLQYIPDDAETADEIERLKGRQ